jgi:hypothetical protein
MKQEASMHRVPDLPWPADLFGAEKVPVPVGPATATMGLPDHEMDGWLRVMRNLTGTWLLPVPQRAIV